jgi:rRNA-processing protein FCF1
MFKIAVTDANIFIDLIILELIVHLFQLELQIHTTREVYDQLNAGQKQNLQHFCDSEQLLVYNFNIQEIAEIQSLDFPSGLEPADRTVFYYARKLNSIVISGDNKLRKFCESKGLKVYGIIWLFDQLVELDLIPKTTAVSKLERLLGYNDRLPIEEIMKRLKKWKAV